MTKLIITDRGAIVLTVKRGFMSLHVRVGDRYQPRFMKFMSIHIK